MGSNYIPFDPNNIIPFVNALIKDENICNEALHLNTENGSIILFSTKIAQKVNDVYYLMDVPVNENFFANFKEKRRTQAYESTKMYINTVREKLTVYSCVIVDFVYNYDGDLTLFPKKLISFPPKGFSYRNVICSGTPGSGKSFFVKNYAIPEIVGSEDPEVCEQHTVRVTFTESYTNEAFFGCFKPKMSNDNKVTYGFVPGPFCQIVSKAFEKPDENWVLVIEELNRANVYEVFGSVFQLLDRDERGYSTYPISLPEEAVTWFRENTNLEEEDKKDFTRLILPSNLYIICTMNNADSNVQFLDTAFKRRFSNAYMDEESVLYASEKVPGVRLARKNEEMKKNLCIAEGVLSEEEYHAMRKKINEVLRTYRYSDDKLLANHFIWFSEQLDSKTNKSVKFVYKIDFVVSVLGYLLQNVFRGRAANDAFTKIFAGETDPSVSVVTLIKKSMENSGKNLDLSKILNSDIMK